MPPRVLTLYWRWLWSVPVHLIPAVLFAQDPAYTQFTAADGLPSQMIYATTQDHEGYMWFGTDAGACRFDGSTFRTFTTSDGLGDNEVLRIFCDSHDRVWFLSLNGRSAYYKHGSIHNTKSDPYLAQLGSSQGTTDCVEDHAGNLYFGSIGGQVTRLAGEHVEVFQVPLWNRSESIGLVPSTSHGALIVSGLSILSPAANGDLKVVRRWSSIWRPSVTVFKDGTPIRVGPAGIETLITGQAITGPLPNVGEIRGLWPQSDNSLWVSYRSGGVLHILPNGTRMDRLFSDHVISTVFEDLDKNIWFGTLGQGVFLSTQEQLGMRVYQPSRDQFGNNPTAVRNTPDGCWVGTDQGGMYRLRNDTLETIVEAVPGMRDRVRSIVRDQRSRMDVAKDRTAYRLTQLENGWLREPIHLYSTDGVDAELKSLALTCSGHVLASGFGLGELIETDGGPSILMHREWAPTYARTYCALADTLERIWFETAQRLHSIFKGQMQEFPELDHLFGARITSLAMLPGGQLVAASAGGGVSILNEGKLIRQFTTRDGMSSDQCRKVMVHDGVLFVGTASGVTRIENPLGTPNFRRWTTNEGLPVNDVMDLAVTDTSMLLAMSAGLCVVPLTGPAIKRPPALAFRSVELDRVLQSPATIQHFVQGRSALSITLQALVFTDRKGLRYSYRIGQDQPWISSTDPLINLTDLPLGDQQIELRAELPGSGPGGLLKLHVQVTAPWYATLWARAGMALGLVVLGLVLAYAIMGRRTRTQRRVWEREQAVNVERQRIAADMHDDLGAEISSLMMSARTMKASNSPSEGTAMLAEVVESRTRNLMNKIDEIVWSLAPESDALLPTITFIQRYAEEFTALNNLGFRATVSDVDGDKPITASVRRDLYLSIKEALRNVAQHAQATSVQLTIQGTPIGIRFIVEDNGSAPKAATRATGGHGLINMRERIHRMGGELTVQPSTTGGTQVVIELSHP